MAVAVLLFQLVHHEVRNLLEGNLGGFLAAPIGQSSPRSFCVFEARNIVAASAGQLGNRFLSNVVEERGVAIGTGQPKQHPLITLNRRLVSSQTIFQNLGSSNGWKPFFEIHQR